MRAHRAHDYQFLVARWRAVSLAAKVPLKILARADGFDLFHLTSPRLTASGGLYLSAGIHGDEPGATEGLIAWAEKNVQRLAELPVLIVPCLNPWGLVRNMRTSANGEDLNRLFHHDTHPVIAALKRVVRPFHFAAALHLHEDYDAQGLYLYEVERSESSWGEALLARGARAIPADPRVRIDGRKAHAGLIRRRYERRRFAKIGHPEAIWMHLSHADRTFTVETPSEFALERRVRAHAEIVGECVRRLQA